MTEISPKPNIALRQAGKLSLQVILLIVIFVLCLVILFSVTEMIFKDKNLAFDEHVFSLIAPHITAGRTSFMQAVTFFGSVTFLLPANILLAGVFLFIKNHRWYSLKIAAVSITSTAVMFLLKDILKRQRPLLPVIAKVHGYSFPSGHSFSSLVFFGMLAYIAYRTIKNNFLKWLLMIGCFCLALLIGFSRVYLKVHFASDVIAGFCLGIIWLVLARWLLIKTEKMTGNKSGPGN